MQKRIKFLQLAIFCAFVLIACDSDAIYDNYKSVNNQWHKDSIINFNFKSPDTTNHYNLFVNLRNNYSYKFSNLFLIVELNHPNGKTIKDTLEYKMAAPNGELLGSGFSDVKENKLWYKGYENPFRFTEIGDYKVNIQHAMRNNGEAKGLENLEGITEIGFRIEHALK